MNKRRWKKIFLVSAAVVALSGCGKGVDPSAEVKQEESNEKQVADTKTEEMQTKKELKDESSPVFIAKGIRKLVVKADGQERYSISYEPQENEGTYEYWKMEIPYEKKAIVDTEEMLSVYELLAELDFAEQENVAGADTGIEESTNSIQIEFCQTTKEDDGSGDSVSLKENADSKCTLRIGKEAENGKYYTALESAPEKIFLMDKEPIDRILKKDPFALIVKVGTMAAVNTVSRVEISIEDKTYEMTSKDGEYTINGKKTDEASYKKLYSQLLGIFVVGENPDKSKPAKHCLISMRFEREGVEDLSVSYYEYDEKYAIMNQDGVENYLVDKEDVEILIAAIKKS